jgi:hypothetical protein
VLRINELYGLLQAMYKFCCSVPFGFRTEDKNTCEGEGHIGYYF